MKTVLIQGDMVHRFDGSKHIEKAQIDPDGQDLAASIEHFRVNGLPEAPPAEPPPAGEVAFERLAKFLEHAACARCGGRMASGVAIAQTWRGSPDFPGDTGREICSTMTCGGPGRLIECRKCELCGWSVTL